MRTVVHRDVAGLEPSKRPVPREFRKQFQRIRVPQFRQGAQRFGEGIAAANSARFDMDAALAKLMDRLQPLVDKLAELTFRGVEWLTTVADEGLKDGLKTLDLLLQVLPVIQPLLVVYTTEIRAIRRSIAQGLEVAAPANRDFIMNEWNRMRGVIERIRPGTFGPGATSGPGANSPMAMPAVP
jgi:hypothetical protein